jgi:hypothetical protein
MQLLLFLGIFCLFFFIPVQFVIAYTNENWRGRATLELSFLNGLLRRKREIQLQIPRAIGIETETAEEGRWFWMQKRTIHRKISPLQGQGSSFWEVLDRYRHFGIGITLLSYFLPAGYHRWLLVAENLEKRGEFYKLTWLSRIGTGDSALTAVSIGLVWGLKTVFIDYLRNRYEFTETPEVNVSGNFQSAGWGTVFNCIFRVKLGYIMIASLMVKLRHAWRKGGVGNE